MADIHQDEHLKRQHERVAAKRFLDWLRQNSRRRLVISREREGPDFECRDQSGDKTLCLEIATSYYNEHEAKGAWDVARGKTQSYTSDVLRNPDEGLAEFINKQVDAKCGKQYDVDYPVLTTEKDILDTVLPAIRLPTQIPFQEIYLGVDLPISIGEPSRHEGQYWVWRLYPSPS